MKTRPILFSAPMVRAILARQKTQTRRIVNPHTGYQWLDLDAGTMMNNGGHKKHISDLSCHYGKPVDRLWVREAWACTWKTPGPGSPVIYRAGHDESEGYGPRVDVRWRPSIHMPRQASRITLEITGVRVERLQDISEADAIAEGLERTSRGHWLPGPCDHPEWAYHLLWDQINGAGAWAANPWVWVLEFRRVEADA